MALTREAAPAAPPLLVHVIHHLVVGGMENGLVNLVNHLPREAYRHAVVCIEDYSDFRHRIARDDVEVIALHRSRIGARGVRAELFRLFRRLRPALVHSRNLSGLDALLPARLAGVKRCVHGEHGWDVDNLDGLRWKPRLLRRLHAPLVDRYITVSRDLQRFLEQRVGIRGSRIAQIYNGVDTARFKPPADRAAALALLPPDFRDPSLVRIGSVGRLQPVKDQAALLRAFATLLDQDPARRATARLLLVGDGPLRAELPALADALGIAAQTWFPGARSDVAALLGSFDVFALPSLNEGISNTLLEAMASGVPVVASRVGGNVELVTDGEGGALFEAGDVDGLAARLGAYLDDPALRTAHGAAARALALRRFSLPAMVDGYRRVYDGLLAAPS